MEKRSSNDKNVERSSVVHYVAKKNTVLNRISGSCDVNVSTLRLGMLVEAVEVLRDGGLRIRVTDPGGSELWLNTEWRCHRYDLVPVSLIMWQYLAAVPSPQDRVKLATDKQLTKDLNDVRLNSKVIVTPDAAEEAGNEQILAIVKYVGPVHELGPGFYFGLEILGNQNRQLPQNVESTQRYFTTAHGNGVFVNLSNVRPYKTDLLDFGDTDERRNPNSEEDFTKICKYLHKILIS